MRILFNVDNIRVSAPYSSSSIQLSPLSDIQEVAFYMDIPENLTVEIEGKKVLDIEGVRFIIRNCKRLVHLDLEEEF